MSIIKNEFKNYAERILYGRIVRFSEKNFIDHKTVSRQAQEQLHDLMSEMILEIQKNPVALNIPDIPDNPMKPGWTATHFPEHAKQRGEVTVPIDLPFDLLYVIGKYGVWIENNDLRIEINSFKKNFKDLMKSLDLTIEFLSIFGFKIEIYPIGVKRLTHMIVSHSANVYLLHALKLLAEVNNIGYDYKGGFNICSFDGDRSFYIERLNSLLGFGSGYIQSVLERYKKRGYEINYDILGFSTNKNGSGCGISFRDYEQPSFAFSSSALGIKAMLTDYSSLDKLVQQFLAENCRNCNNCMFCAKGKGGVVTKKQHTQNIVYNDKSYHLCPYYPNIVRHNHKITKEVIEQVFSFNIVQEKFAKDWRKPKT